MSRGKDRPEMGLKLEVTVIPSKYLDWTLANIARHFGNGPLLWPGGAGRAQGIKFVPYEIKKKRGRKPKPKEKAVRQPEPGSAKKTTT
ncbi:MAG: hypothetical protein KJ822_17230 [Proteobacteria bacterium]|nr:hypothetical protein [Pseudomonadota bacterium]